MILNYLYFDLTKQQNNGEMDVRTQMLSHLFSQSINKTILCNLVQERNFISISEIVIVFEIYE